MGNSQHANVFLPFSVYPREYAPAQATEVRERKCGPLLNEFFFYLIDILPSVARGPVSTYGGILASFAFLACMFLLLSIPVQTVVSRYLPFLPSSTDFL